MTSQVSLRRCAEKQNLSALTHALLPRNDPVIFLFFRLEVADVVLFKVDVHPVELTVEFVALTFWIIVGYRQRQIAGHVDRFVRREEERNRVPGQLF